MKNITFAEIVGGIIISVLAGLVVVWLQLKFFSPTCTAKEAEWQRQLRSGGGNTFGDKVYAYGLAPDAVPNMNMRPESPASAYAFGAPTPTYRPYLRIGKKVVPAQ